MKLVGLVLIAGLGACDVVYGLPDRPSDGAIVDAGPAIHVTGTFVRTHVLTNPAHVPFTMTGTYTSEDRPVVTSFGLSIPVDWNMATGTFAFDAPVPYEVSIGPNEWQSRASMLAIDDIQFSRPGAVNATTVSLNISLAETPASNSQWELISTGVWTRTPINMMPSGTLFDWTTSNFYSLGPRLLDSSAGDVLSLATYQPGPMSSLVLNEYAQASIQMREGTQDVMFDSNPVAGTNPGCTHVTHTAKSDVDRMINTYPSSTSSVGGWELDAVPAPEFGVRVPHLLSQRYSPSGDHANGDIGFGQPYTGFAVVLSQITTVTRMLDGTPLHATAVYQDHISPGAGCPVTSVGGARAALPINAKLAGVPLKNDNLTLGASSAEFAELTWETIGDVPDLYYVELFEAPATGAFVPVRIYMTGEPRVRIAKRTLEPGTRYITRISTRTGRPGAIDGDFTRYEFPTSAGVAFTSAFTFVQ